MISFNSPLAAHLSRSAAAAGGDGRLGERRTPLSTSSGTGVSISIGREHLLPSDAGALPPRSGSAGADAGDSTLGSPTDFAAIDAPGAALQEFAVHKQRAAVAAAAAAMQSPAAQPGRSHLRSPSAGAGRAGSRLQFSTPLAGSRLQTPPGGGPTPGSSGRQQEQQQEQQQQQQAAASPATAQPLRSSFKQQAQQLLLRQQQQQQQQARQGSAAASTGGKRWQLPAHDQQQQRRQQAETQLPPPTQSLEEAMGQLQLKAGLADAVTAAAAAATPGLKIRSRGLLTQVDTPRDGAAPTTRAPGLPLERPPGSSRLQTPRLGEGTTPLLQQQEVGGGHPEGWWSPLVPATDTPATARGAGVLGTVRKAQPPQEAASSSGGGGGSGSGKGAHSATPLGSAAAGTTAAAAAGAGPAAAAATSATPRLTPAQDGGGAFGRALADDPAAVRRQLQGLAPELMLTQVPAGATLSRGSRGPAAAAATTAAGAAAQRPAPVPDREAAAGLLERMQRLQAAAAALLQEQAAAVRCSATAGEFRGLALELPGAAASMATAAPGAQVRAEQRTGKRAAPAGGQQQLQQQRGPGVAAVQRLAQLQRLQAAGAELAAGLA